MAGPLAHDPLIALRAGNALPFEEFVQSCTRTLVAFFRQRGAAPDRAEDLTQEVFLKLYQGAGRYEPRERFSAYAFRVAHNVWIDDCRRGATRPSPAPASDVGPRLEPEAPRVEPGSELALAEEEHGLRALLSALSPAHRRVFELSVLGELSYGEIAALLAIPVGTVKSRMFHAVRRLRLTFEERRVREGVA